LKRELSCRNRRGGEGLLQQQLGDFEVPEKVHVRHILLLTIDPATHAPLLDDQVKAKRKQMDDILKRLRAGEDSPRSPHKHEDPGTKDDGGELPPFARAQRQPRIRAGNGCRSLRIAAFSLTTTR